MIYLNKRKQNKTKRKIENNLAVLPSHDISIVQRRTLGVGLEEWEVVDK